MFGWKGFDGKKESEIADENSVINAEFKGEYKLEITETHRQDVYNQRVFDLHARLNGKLKFTYDSVDYESDIEDIRARIDSINVSSSEEAYLRYSKIKYIDVIKGVTDRLKDSVKREIERNAIKNARESFEKIQKGEIDLKFEIKL